MPPRAAVKPPTDLTRQLFDCELRSKVTRTRLEAWFCHALLARWLKHHCGPGAKQKRLPTFVWRWSSSDQRRLFDALLAGDGTVRRLPLRFGSPERGTRVYWQVATASPTLADEVRDLLLANGVVGCLSERRLLHGRLAWTLGGRMDALDRWHDGAPVAAVRNTVCRVDRVPYTGLVHNLEVETEHTYATLAGTVCNCHAAGDVFGFVMLAENLDFGRALRRLADRAGVPLAPRRADDRAARLLAANAAAAELFRTWLGDPAGVAARSYLAARGLGAEALAAFGVGWAPEGWDTLVRALGARGFAPADLAVAGLSVARDDGRVHDRFRGRVVFPIRDADGRVLGFGGRLLGEGQPKYLNSAESPLFSKRACLFGLDLARSAIRRERCAVVVEGYVDAVACRQAGLEHVVAPMGTAVSAEQLALLKRLAPRVVLALDPDAAGDAAALRTLEALRATRGRVAVPVPDRRGLVRLRYDQELDVRVARLPAGQDPDEVVRAGAEGFRALVAAARPLIEVLIEAEVDRAGADVHARSAAADAVLAVLGELGNPVLADGFVRLLGERLGVEPAVLRERLRALRRAGRGRRAAARAEAAAPEPTSRGWLTLEEFVLRLLLMEPSASALAAGEDITRGDARALCEGVRSAVAAGAGDTAAVLEALDAPLRAQAELLLAWGADLPETPTASLAAETAGCLRNLRLLNHHREIALIGARLQDLEDAGDRAGVVEELGRVSALTAAIRRLEREGGPAPTTNWAAALRAEAGAAVPRAGGARPS